MLWPSVVSFVLRGPNKHEPSKYSILLEIAILRARDPVQIYQNRTRPVST